MGETELRSRHRRKQIFTAVISIYFIITIRKQMFPVVKVDMSNTEMLYG